MKINEDIRKQVFDVIEQGIIEHGVSQPNRLHVLRDTNRVLSLLGVDFVDSAEAPAIPDGYHMIATQDGRRLSRMTQREYDGYINGNSIRYANFEIVAKRDFGKIGFYDAKSRTNLREGWVVTERGANVMPGATWAHTQDEAMLMIDCYVAADRDGSRFWHMLRAIQRATGKLS